MAVISGNVKKQKSMLGILTLCSLFLIGVFIAVFLSTNNVKISFDAIFNGDKYPAQAFVNKRKGLLTANVEGSISGTGMTTGANLSAKIDYDTTDKKVKVTVRDENNRPASRITVIGTVVRVGQKRITQQFKMREYGAGDFRSIPLDLAEGGWILTVTAYDLYSNNKDKLLFYTERAIFLGKK